MFFFILFRCECLCAVRACFSPRACARMCEVRACCLSKLWMATCACWLPTCARANVNFILRFILFRYKCCLCARCACVLQSTCVCVYVRCACVMSKLFMSALVLNTRVRADCPRARASMFFFLFLFCFCWILLRVSVCSLCVCAACPRAFSTCVCVCVCVCACCLCSIQAVLVCPRECWLPACVRANVFTSCFYFCFVLFLLFVFCDLWVSVCSLCVRAAFVRMLCVCVVCVHLYGCKGEAECVLCVCECARVCMCVCVCVCVCVQGGAGVCVRGNVSVSGWVSEGSRVFVRAPNKHLSLNTQRNP